MAESEKKSTKRRQLKKTETVRERASKNEGTLPTKNRRVKKAAKGVFVPFKLIWTGLKFIGRPFSFLLIPFKTKPARFVGRILGKVLLLNFFKESWKELRQVSWPTGRETARLTVAVFTFSLVFGTVIAVTDFGLGKLFKILFLG